MAHLNYVLAGLLCGCVLAQLKPQRPRQPALACNMKAISVPERVRYTSLLNQIKRSVNRQRETGEGYVWELSGTGASLKDAADWAMLERRCCPFLVIRLEAAGVGSDFRISLTGPEGVKAFLISEFGEVR